MGLLDQFSNLNPEQTQGLLAAASQMLQGAGDPRRSFGIGPALGVGIESYQASTAQAKRRKLEEEQAAMQKQLYGMKIRDAESDFANQEATRKRSAGLQELYGKFGQGGQSQSSQPDMSRMNGPTIANAQILEAQQSQPSGAVAEDLYSQKIGFAKQLRAAGYHLEADAEEEKALKFREEYSTTPQAMTGADGKLGNYQLAKYGSAPRSVGLGVAPDMTEVDLGDRKQFVDKNQVKDGQTYSVAMSPDTRANTNLGFARIKANASLAPSADGLLPQETLSMMAQQYRAGDTSVMQNLGRGAQGAQNIIRLRNEIAKQATDAGQGGADLASKNAEYFGTKAGQRTAGTRIANVEMASTEAATLIPLARQASAEVQRSGFLPFGKGQIMFDDQTNDPAMRKFAAANNSLINVYARAISPSGTPTVADKEHAREMLSTAMDQKSYNAVLDQMNLEISAARQAPKAVRQAFNAEVTGKDSHSPAAPAAPAPTMAAMPTANASNKDRVLVDHQTGKRYKSNGMQWKEVN